jgi:predicted transcriptional regulator
METVQVAKKLQKYFPIKKSVLYSVDYQRNMLGAVRLETGF